jgi:hypothetical protein
VTAPRPYPEPIGACIIKLYAEYNPVMTIGDLAELFRISPQNAESWMSAKTAPAALCTTKAGRVFLTSAIFAWAEATRRTIPSPPHQATTTAEGDRPTPREGTTQ